MRVKHLSRAAQKASEKKGFITLLGPSLRHVLLLSSIPCYCRWWYAADLYSFSLCSLHPYNCVSNTPPPPPPAPVLPWSAECGGTLHLGRASQPASQRLCWCQEPGPWIDRTGLLLPAAITRPFDNSASDVSTPQLARAAIFANLPDSKRPTLRTLLGLRSFPTS